MPHGKLQMIKVQISPRPPSLGFIWSMRQKMQLSCQISIKIYSYSWQRLSPYPLKDKGSLKSTDGFYDQSK